MLKINQGTLLEDMMMLQTCCCYTAITVTVNCLHNMFITKSLISNSLWEPTADEEHYLKRGFIAGML